MNPQIIYTSEEWQTRKTDPKEVERTPCTHIEMLVSGLNLMIDVTPAGEIIVMSDSAIDHISDNVINVRRLKMTSKVLNKVAHE